MNIARVIDGVVVNLEVADQGWIDANTPSPDGAVFVQINDWETAHMGLRWDEVGGFEQPPSPPPSVPGPGEEWDLGELTPDQNADDIAAELEKILAGE